MLNAFRNPSNKYRPIPFWSWNDQLEIKELEEQIESMNKAGLGGYFMHARSGIKTAYLGDEWFECIEAGIKKGKEVGMDAWIYDEEGWPSGFAGGLVTSLSPEFHAKFMTLEEHDSMKEIECQVMLALYKWDTHGHFERITKEAVIEKGEKLFSVRKHVNPYYIDVMNKAALDAFLECTHDQYYEKFKDDFGTVMQGFFTDEPRFSCNRLGQLAWSDTIPAVFKMRFGYDILDYLPSLFRDLGNFEKVRYDFWMLANELFVHNYMKNIYDWCERHNCKLTGHIMLEESIFSQMTSSAGVMPFYEYEHIPGIDWLRRRIDSPIIGKQVGSVACQLGKKQVLTESYGLCGWNTSFEEFKWIAEWQYVNGVNMLCQHLQAYSLKGARKRDYPPSIYTQQTWWNEYKAFNDYMGRLGVLLSSGSQEADILLLHPIRSGFVSYDGTRTDRISLLDDRFEEISNDLSGLHLSYHYGDETIMSKYGKVKDNEFIVGEVSYKTVVLPHMYAIDGTTVKRLNQFIANGGMVVSMGALPSYINGCEDDLTLLKEQIKRATKETIRPLLMEQGLISLSIREDKEEVKSISYQRRDTEEGTVFFLVNHSQENTFDTVVEVYNKTASVKRLIAETGEIEEMSYWAGKNTTFKLKFEPMQSYIVLLQDTNEHVFEKEEEDAQIVLTTKGWNIKDMSLNTLTLDQCTYRIDDEEVIGPIPVIKLMEILLEKRRPCKVELGFEFNVDMELEKNKEFYVVIEGAHLYDLTVNGQVVAYKEIGWWKDKSFKKIDIKKHIKQGTNAIQLKTNFKQSQKVYDILFGENVYETEKNKLTYDMEIECIYLLGDFGVISETPYREIERKAAFTEGPFTIINQPTLFKDNNFTREGLLFFAGDLRITQKLNVNKDGNKKIVLDMQKPNAPIVKIYINGHFVKNILWAPYTVDITDYVIEGENELELQLFASNRNLFGPHHHIKGECYNVGPDSFVGKWSWVERHSEADATAVVNRNQNLWTDEFCFVDFGLALSCR